MLSLVHSSSPILHQVAEPIQADDDVRDLIAQMFKVMKEHEGTGLAAPQVGVSKRVIVVSVGGFNRTYVNPVIVRRGEGQSTKEEGCLSFPLMRTRVTRDNAIWVEALDQNMQPVRHKLKGLTARCVQHEVDHLDGITIA